MSACGLNLEKSQGLRHSLLHHRRRVSRRKIKPDKIPSRKSSKTLNLRQKDRMPNGSLQDLILRLALKKLKAKRKNRRTISRRRIKRQAERHITLMRNPPALSRLQTVSINIPGSREARGTIPASSSTPTIKTRTIDHTSARKSTRTRMAKRWQLPACMTGVTCHITRLISSTI
jgi:hypothetical protein